MKNSYDNRTNKYTSTNYVDVFELLVPGFYKEEDLATSGTELDPLNAIINSQIEFCNRAKTQNFFGAGGPLSGITDDEGVSVGASANRFNYLLSGITDTSGLAKFFVKQNKLTSFGQFEFERDILLPLNYSFSSFDSSSDFKDFVSGTLMSSIQFQGEQGQQESVTNNEAARCANIHTKTSGAYGPDVSSTHGYLLDKLGWFYLLNLSGTTSEVTHASSIVLDRLVDTTYFGKRLETVDGVLALTRFLWDNSAVYPEFTHALPGNYFRGSEYYTSGTQNRDKLETLIRVLYSDMAIDEADEKVADAFDRYFFTSSFLGASAGETVPSLPQRLQTGRVSKGPLHRFLRAASYLTAEVTNNVEKLADIYDIQQCPEEYLDLIANLIGWKFFGHEVSKKRSQLNNALNIYKKLGTSAAVDLVAETLYGKDSVNLSSTITEAWESYIPYQILYCFLTGGGNFKTEDSWTRETAEAVGVLNWSSSGSFENAKILTDYALLDVAIKNLDYFRLANSTFPIYRFHKMPVKRATPNPNFLSAVDEETIYSVIHPGMTKPFAFYNANDEENEETLTHFANAYGHEGSYLIPKVGPAGRGWYLTDINLDEDTRFLFCSGSPNFVFNYRGHTGGFPMPPFEEVLYYKDVNLNQKILQDLRISLASLGVPDTLASGLKDFATEVMTRRDKPSRTHGAMSNFLYFSPSAEYPPNYDEVTENPGTKFPEYLPFWNSKSSHFFCTLSAGDFDFAKTSMEGDSGFVLDTIARAVRDVSPAKAIPKTIAELNEEHKEHWFAAGNGIDQTMASNWDPNIILLENETQEPPGPISDEWQRRQSISYVRDGLTMPLDLNADIAQVPDPNTEGGFYPLGWAASGNGGAGAYFPIVDAVDLPDVYKAEVTRDSGLSFFGVRMSHTYPCRGDRPLLSNNKMPELTVMGSHTVTAASSHDTYEDRTRLRGEERLSYDLFNKIWEIVGEDLAKHILGDENFVYRESWQNVPASWATKIRPDFNFSQNSYFSQDMQEIWDAYNRSPYDSHTLSFQDLFAPVQGANIFSHAFGPLLYNSEFGVDGSGVSNPAMIQNSFDASSPRLARQAQGALLGGGSWGLIDAMSGCFSLSGHYPAGGGDSTAATSGSLIASDLADIFIPPSGSLADRTLISNPYSSDGHGTHFPSMFEFRNPGIIKNVELVAPSFITERDYFQVAKIPAEKFTDPDNAAANKLMLKLKGVDSMLRVRFDLNHNTDYNGTNTEGNRFRLGSDFELCVSSYFANEGGNLLGGGTYGVWIHTKPITHGSNGPSNDGTYMASFIPKGNTREETNVPAWHLHKIEDLTEELVVSRLSFIYTHPETRARSKDEGIVLNNNSTSVSAENSTYNPRVLDMFKTSYLNNDKLEFNTHAENIPPGYSLVLGWGNNPVLAEDTDYVVEIFKLPDPAKPTKFMMLNGVSIIDKGLNKLCKAYPNWPDIQYVYEDQVYGGLGQPIPFDLRYADKERYYIPITKEQLFYYLNSDPTSFALMAGRGDNSGNTSAGSTIQGTGVTATRNLSVCAVVDEISAKNKANKTTSIFMTEESP